MERDLGDIRKPRARSAESIEGPDARPAFRKAGFACQEQQPAATLKEQVLARPSVARKRHTQTWSVAEKNLHDLKNLFADSSASGSVSAQHFYWQE